MITLSHHNRRRIQFFFVELFGWTLSIVIALIIFAASFVGAQDRKSLLDEIPKGNYISCIEVTKGHTVCTLNAIPGSNFGDFKVDVPTKTFRSAAR